MSEPGQAIEPIVPPVPFAFWRFCWRFGSLNNL